MVKSSHAKLSEQLRNTPAPTSPAALDQRILDYAREQAPKTPHRSRSQWVPATLTFSIMVIAVLLVLQPPTPLRQGQLPQSVITDFPLDKMRAAGKSDNSSTVDSALSRTQSTSTDTLSTTMESPVLENLQSGSAAKTTTRERSARIQPARLTEQPTSIITAKPQALSDLSATNQAAETGVPAQPLDSATGIKSEPATTSSSEMTAFSESSKGVDNEIDSSNHTIDSNRNKNDSHKENNDPADINNTIDTDNDGLPDIWEQLFELDSNNPDDAHLDLDNDGLSNLQEYKLGTNPVQRDADNNSMPARRKVKH